MQTNHTPTLIFLALILITNYRTTINNNKTPTFVPMHPFQMLCLGLAAALLLLLAPNADAQRPGYLTVAPPAPQQPATIDDARRPVKAIKPEIFTTSYLPAASPAGMVTSIATNLAGQQEQENTVDNKLAISTSQSFPEQQSYSQPRIKQDIITFPKVSPQYLTKPSRTNNVRPQQGGFPNYPDEEAKVFPELLPVVTLVEKLQSQVLDLQRMRIEDRSQLSQIQSQLLIQQEQISVLTSDMMQLKQLTVNHGHQTSQLANIVQEQKMSQKSLVNMETELKVRLDDFVLSQRNISQTMSAMKSSTQQLASKTDVIITNANNMKKTLQKLSNTNHKNSKAIKNLKKVIKGFTVESVPEKKEDTLNMDLALDEGLMVDVEANKLPQRVGNIITDLEEHSGANPMEDSASKTVPEEQLDESVSTSPSLVTKNETLFLEMKKHNQRLTKVYDLFFNLSLDVRNLQNKVQKNNLAEEIRHLQEIALNLTERLSAIEGAQVPESDPESEQSISEKNTGKIAKFVFNHTRRFQDMEHQLVMRQNNAFQKQHSTLQKHMIQLVNTSANNLQRTMDQIQNKYDNKLNDKLKHMNRDMHGINDKIMSLEARILNVSLSACQRVNNDLKQDIMLRDAEKRIMKLRTDLSSNKDQIKRIEYRLYRMHHWMKNHTGLLDFLKTKTDSLYQYIPMFDQVEEDIYNLRLHLPKDCSSMNEGGILPSGVMVIYPRGSFSTVQVFCDADTDGAWTVIQKRFNGSVDFNRSWDDYKYGFGSVDSEYWLGNEFIHLLTSKDNYSLKIEMVDIYGKFWVATYDSFHLLSEPAGYALKVSSFSGNATDSLNYSNNSPFSTLDVDHDASSTHCAVHYTAGWWYRHCHYGNLNGRYKVGIVWFNQELNDWIQMKSTVMKIKRNAASTSSDQFLGQ